MPDPGRRSQPPIAQSRVLASAPAMTQKDRERISLQEVRKVANLARLSLSDEALETMRNELDGILDWMTALSALDTTGIEPTYHPATGGAGHPSSPLSGSHLPSVEMAAALREDIVRPGLRREEALRGAAKSEAGAFAVPKVMEGE